MEQTQKQKNGFMMKLATFIVDKRNLFLLITIILLVFSAFSRNWVEVENDQTAYLPASCETEQALNVMSDQFTTYGTAEVMVANITYDETEALSGRIVAVKGVQSVAFDDETSGHYARTYGKLMGNIASYKVPLIDMFLFVCEQADAGIIQLDAEQMSMLSAAARSSQCCSCCSFCRRFCCSAADWRIRPASPCPPLRGRTSRASVFLSSAL